MHSHTGSRLSQGDKSSTIADSSSGGAGIVSSVSTTQVYQYQQQPVNSRSNSGRMLTTSAAIARRPIMSKLLQDSVQAKSHLPGNTQSKPQSISTVKGEPAAIKPVSETGNQLISLPFRLENIQGRLQLVPANTAVSGGTTALIPVILSGNQLFQLQGNQAVQQTNSLVQIQSSQNEKQKNEFSSVPGVQSSQQKNELSQIREVQGLHQKNELSQTEEVQGVHQKNELPQTWGVQDMHQNNTWLVSNSSAEPHSSISKQNSTLTKLLAAPPKHTTDSVLVQRSSSGLSRQSIPLDHHSVTSADNSNLKPNSQLFSGTTIPATKSLASPVYKSKLEKAMAQNLLIQNSARKVEKTVVLSSSNETPAPLSSIGTSQTYMESQSKNSSEFSGQSHDMGAMSDCYYNKEDHSNRPIPQEMFQNYLSSDLQNFIRPEAKGMQMADYYKTQTSERDSHFMRQHYDLHGSDLAPVQMDPTAQYSLIPDPDYFQVNPKIMDVFSLGHAPQVSNIDLDEANSQNANSSYATVQTGSGFHGNEQVQEFITDRMYEDSFLAKNILKRLWDLREEGALCDAALYTETKEFRCHKVVLAGLSPEMAKAMETQQDLQMILPNNVSEENTLMFLFYIYHGVIKLNRENVQQIYRLSETFGASELKRHCMDFCKTFETEELGNYDDESKQCQKELYQPDIQFGNTTTNQNPTNQLPTNQNQLTECEQPQAANVTVEITPTVSDPNKDMYETLETISSEIDWITNDPSQSNIPIRKRGRNRKTMQNNDLKSKGPVPAQITSNEPKDSIVKGKSNIPHATKSRTFHPKKNELSKLELSQFANEYVDMFIQQQSVNKHTGAGNTENSEDTVSKENKLIEEFVDQLAALPDPLVTGKLDETELMKLESNNNAKPLGKGKRFIKRKKDSLPQTVGKTVMTRFRTRTSNMSVIEAATQMKAKSNDTNTTTTANRAKRTVNVKSIAAKQAEDIGAMEDSVVSAKVKDAGKGDSDTVKLGKLDHNILETLTRTNNANKELEQTVSTEKQKQDDSDKKSVNHIRQATGLDEHDIAKYPSAPKKARLRRSTTDQKELKDTVYMRPPPKKRTKEIREMMEHEQDEKGLEIELEENAIKVDVDLAAVQKKELEKENTVVKAKNRRKRPKVKNDAIMAQVYEVEKNAAAIDSEKLYRCTFCSVEFKFAKRAVTHLIGTHDTDLEDAPQFITVHKKSENIQELKECDICGYKPKESGTYYIHYHKYFRHQVPLPKGWQAYKCEICSKEFFTKFQLREHKLIHFEDNPFVCETCGSGFRSRTCLNSHVFHKHSTIRKHKCPDCPKSFKTATQVKVHQRTHSGEKPFLCPTGTCVYRSTTRGNMKLHLNSKHRLHPDSIKVLMKTLEASEVDHDREDLLASELSTSKGNVNDSTVYNVLVETQKADETYGVGNGCEQYLPNQIENLNQNVGMVADYTETGSDNNQVPVSARDFSMQLGNQCSMPSQDLSMVIGQDNHILEAQNIPRHVEMLIRDADSFMQDQENSGQTGFGQDFQHSVNDAENVVQDMRNRIPESVSFAQSYAPPGSMDTSRYVNTNQMHTVHKVIDPHSKEARMIIREALEGHSARSLLKSAISRGSGNQEARRFELGSQQVPDSTASQDSTFLNEAEKLVIDLQESGDNQISPEEVIQRLRSQVSGQSHSMAQTPYQTYQNPTGSPPVYSNTSHGLLSIPVSDILTQSSVSLTPSSVAEGQSQGHSLQAGQGQMYQATTSQSPTSQYGTNGNVYQGYYQDQYDIENY